MASRFSSRIMNSASKSFFQSATNKTASSSFPKFSFPTSTKSTSSPLRRFSLSRCPSELGAVMSMLPLHNAVAAARMTSCLSPASRTCRALSQELGLSVPR